MKLTPQQAGAALREHANTIFEQRGGSYDDAWLAARNLHPELVEALHSGATTLDHRGGPINFALSNEQAHQAFLNPRAQAAFKGLHDAAARIQRETGKPYEECYALAKKQNVALCNDAGIESGGELPSFSPQQAALLGLGANSTAEEFRAAYLGNGGRFTPLNTDGIFEALVTFYTELPAENRPKLTRGEAVALIKEKHQVLARLTGLLAPVNK